MGAPAPPEKLSVAVRNGRGVGVSFFSSSCWIPRTVRSPAPSPMASPRNGGGTWSPDGKTARLPEHATQRARSNDVWMMEGG